MSLERPTAFKNQNGTSEKPFSREILIEYLALLVVRAYRNTSFGKAQKHDVRERSQIHTNEEYSD